MNDFMTVREKLCAGGPRRSRLYANYCMIQRCMITSIVNGNVL